LIYRHGDGTVTSPTAVIDLDQFQEVIGGAFIQF
jgi:hypothetical protein